MMGGRRLTMYYEVPDLPPDALQSCKCNYCDCYTSVAPIRMIDNKVTCGRCKADSGGVRLDIVEALAKQFKFPCRYERNGCTAMIEWLNVDDHEKICDFQEMRCTVYTCTWAGPKHYLKEHFQKSHPFAIINSGKAMPTSLKERSIFNFLYLSQTDRRTLFPALPERSFIVLLLNDGENICHHVKVCSPDVDKLDYVYEISFQYCDKRMTFLNQKLQAFDDTTTEINCKLSVKDLQLIFTNNDTVNVSFNITFNTGSVEILPLLM